MVNVLVKDHFLNTYNKKLEGNTKKNNIYENVLTFPEGTDHLKYFESNPHPDKIPDIMQAFYEATPAPDLNIPYEQKMLEFDAVRKLLEPMLSDMDRLLLRLPDNLQGTINNLHDSDKKMAFSILRDCFLNFFTTPINDSKPDIYWIDSGFANKFNLTERALNDLQNNLFNVKAKNKLVEKLKDAGAFANERKYFYFWNTDPYNWRDISYQSRAVTNEDYFLKIISTLSIPPQLIPINKFTVNAIPEGYVQPKENGKYDICVKKMYYFINDVFNFEGPQSYGHWDLFPQNKSYDPLPNQILIHLENNDFRIFQRHGYGSYFPVMSRLLELKNFDPQCLEYPFDK